jgi:hypothetical protein
MNAEALWRGLLLAVLLSTGGAVVFAVLAPLAGAATSLRVSLLLAASAWMLDQLRHAGPGRLLAGSAWIVMCAALLLINPPLWGWLALLAVALWLGRSLRQPRRLLLCATDCALSLLAAAASLVALRHTGSVWLALWCLLLLQALSLSLASNPGSVVRDANARFDAARRAAERALHALGRTHSPL